MFVGSGTIGSWSLSAVKSLQGHLFMEFVVQGGTQPGEVNLKRFSPARMDSYGERLLGKYFLKFVYRYCSVGLQIL